VDTLIQEGLESFSASSEARQISLMAELHQMVSVSRFDLRSDIAVGAFLDGLVA
jgi:hypothetical protein